MALSEALKQRLIHAVADKTTALELIAAIEAQEGTTVSTNLAAHVADSSDAHDASAISIADAGSKFTATDVEGALAELEARVAALEP